MRCRSIVDALEAKALVEGRRTVVVRSQADAAIAVRSAQQLGDECPTNPGPAMPGRDVEVAQPTHDGRGVGVATETANGDERRVAKRTEPTLARAIEAVGPTSPLIGEAFQDAVAFRHSGRP